MKIFKLSLTLTLLLIGSVLFGQSDFEGEIKYKISYSNLPPEIAGMESMLPQEMVVYNKGAKSRVEQENMGSTQITIADYEAGIVTILIDMMGKKIAMETPVEEIESQKEASEDLKIKYTKETKTIAGVKCKKAIIESPDMTTPMTVYYDPKWKSYDMDFGELKGFPMEYNMSAEGMQMTISATTIEDKSIPDSYFVIPDGYEKMTQEDMMKMFGG